jgi:hypothetical protein
MRFTSPVVTSKDHMGHWGLGVRSKVGKWGGGIQGFTEPFFSIGLAEGETTTLMGA